MLVFWREENPEKKTLRARQEPTTNSAGIKPSGERRVLSPLHHPYSPYWHPLFILASVFTKY